MIVPIRNMAALVLASLALASGSALACCAPANLPGVNVPGVQIGGAYNSGSGAGCCGHPTSGYVAQPGVSIGAPGVAVGTPAINIGGASTNVGGVFVGGGSFNGGGVSFGGSTSLNGGFYATGSQSIISGGGSFWQPQPVSPGVIVSGQEQFVEQDVTETVNETVTEKVSRTRAITRMVAIRAVCIDDRGMPHPASRTSADQDATGFEGELFRCMAGTSMQVTIGGWESGNAMFEGASTMACSKGQALVLKRSGEISCAAQSNEASCHERSLLRRFGPGIKVFSMSKTETYFETVSKVVPRTVTRKVKKQVVSGQKLNLIIDGGVGQSLW